MPKTAERIVSPSSGQSSQLATRFQEDGLSKALLSAVFQPDGPLHGAVTLDVD